MIGRRPPLVQLIERAPGQREERYAQLLTGPVQAAERPAPMRLAAQESSSDLETRVAALEQQVAALTEQVKKLSGQE